MEFPFSFGPSLSRMLKFTLTLCQGFYGEVM